MKNIYLGKRSVSLFVFLAVFIFTSVNISQAADGGSNKVFTLSENLDVDPSTGTSSISIPIEVPQGRAGIAPSITLLYNSSSGNGPLGVGWNLELGNIQRSTRKGTPKYNNTDTFALVQAGSGQELVDISGNGTEFRPDTEGSFSKIKFDGTSWIVTDRKGTKYYFGTSSATRLADPDNASRVFKWCLERVEDLNGNYLTISYIATDIQLYPQEVKYTGNSVASMLPYASVKFLYDAKTTSSDKARSYASGFPIMQTQRLSTIEVRAEGNMVRKYVLNYTIDAVTGKSLLKNTTLYGADGSSTLPATAMSYATPNYTLDPVVQLTKFPAGPFGTSGRFRMMDMNNDGLPDLVYASYPWYSVYINQTQNGQVSFASPVNTANSPQAYGENPDGAFVDLNGDGLVDYISWDLGSNPAVWLNTGAINFSAMQRSSITLGSVYSKGLVQFIDMNGDGAPDIVESVAAGNQAYKIYFNDGLGNFTAPVVASNSPQYAFTNTNIKWGDFNGDGLLDLIFGDGSSYKIWLNNGANGFSAPTNATNFPAGWALSRPDMQVADMNGDGLTDLLLTGNPYSLYLNNGKGDFYSAVVMTGAPTTGTANASIKIMDYNGDHLPDIFWGVAPYQVYLNTGIGGFSSPINLGNYPSVNLNNPNMALIDMNGDGVLDILYGESDTSYKVWSNTQSARQARGNSLIDVDNSVGGHLELQYQNLPIKGLGGMQYGTAVGRPLFNTVKSLARRASLTGDVYKANYEYQNGLWNFKKSEFRGFKTVKMIDPDGNYSVTEYAQDDIYKGRPLTQASYDSQNKLFSKSENTWANQVLYPGVNFSYLKQTDSYIYDGDATGRRTQAQFFYDESPQYGNLTKSINFGEVDLTTGADIGTDKSTTEVTYHNNTTASLLGLPKVTTVKDNNDTLFAKTTFYYDSNSDASVLPTKGYLTKKVDWAGEARGVVHPFTQYTYDTIGNLLTTSDSNNSTTTITYDPTYNLFPLTTTNALGHRVTNEYYGVNGVALSGGDGTFGLWGQLKSTTDPNQKKGLRIYDTFGRTSKMVSPLDTIALPTTSYDYVYGVSQLKVIAKQRIQSGVSATIDSVSFYDGLGRMVESKSNSENPGKYIVGGQAEYNSRGLPVKKYVSYFTTNPISELDTIDTTQPYTLISYDAMGRVLRTTAPDGSYSNGIYDDWNSTSFDENGHMQKSYADAFGRLIKKEEYLGADGRNAAYPASSYSLYATTLYTYDPKGNLIQTQDAKGNITTITYDTLGRKIQMIDPDMGIWKYGYDVEGNLIWQQDAKGQRVNFTYDQIYRLKSKTDLSVLTVNYTYDDVNAQNTKGRLTNAAYSGGNTGFSYDDLGRELQSIKAIGSTNFSVNRTYDAVDRLVTLQYPQSSKVGYTYNQAGLVNSVFQVLPTTVMPPATGGDAVYMASPFSQYRLNENAATPTVTDYGTSKTNVTASVNTSTLSKPGKIGNAFSFNGTSNYVNMDALLNKIRYDSKGSFSMWVKPESGTTLLSFGGSSGYFSIEWSEFNQSVWIGLAPGISASTPNNSVPLGNWTHLAFVQDGVSLKIYVNGQEQPLYYPNANNNKGVWFTNNWYAPLNYGRLGAFNATGNAGSNTSFFKGMIDDVRYYSNKALIPQEVWGIYNNGAGTEAENPAVSNTPPPTVTMIPYMSSAFAQFKLNDNTTNTAVLDETVGYNDGVASQNTNAMSTTGVVNSALSFNGSSQYIDMTSLYDDIKTDTVGTFSMWIKPVRGEEIIGFSGASGYFEIGWGGNQSLVLALAGGQGSAILCATQAGSVPVNTYSHIVVTQDGTHFKIYVNGVVQQNITYWSENRPGAWINFAGSVTYKRLGSMMYGSTPYYFNGNVDDLRYYKKALNTTEVNALYNGGLGTEEANPALSTVPTPLPPLEPSTVPATAGQVYVKNVDYNGLGQMTKVEFGNGVVTTYTYSPTMLRLTNIKTVNALGTVLQNFSYTYDGVGNITAITDAVNTASQTFKYDALNRLTQAVGSYGTKNYTFDEIGNIITKDGLTYTYSKINAGPHAVTSLSDGTTITYDLNGNMSGKTKAGEVFQYLYDSENRLNQVKKNTTLIAEYVYDGDGGRVQKTSYLVTTNSVTNGLFGSLTGTQSITTTPVISKYVGEMYEQTDNVGTAFIFLGSQRIAAIDTTSGTPMFYHGDHLGSTNVMTDSLGNQAELIEYDPYGKIQRHDAASGNNRLAQQQFTGKKLDDETGLIYFGARYYDPLLGKFLTPDEVIQNVSDPSTLNRYSYVSNNPINRADPDGRSWKSFWKRWGNFISPLGRAIITEDWKSFGVMVLNTIAIASGNPWAVAGGMLSMGSHATSQIGGNFANELSRVLGYAATAVAVGYTAWNVGVGIKSWVHEPGFKVMDLNGQPATINSDDKVFVNGILNDENTAIRNATKVGANKIAYNPTHGAIADLTEATLQKITFTSSIDRQLANAVSTLKNVSLIGHSQGAITVSNAMLNLGLRDQRGAVDSVRYINTQISQPRAFITAAIGGARNVVYGSRTWDPSNVAGPNMNPITFGSGIIGLVGGFGVKYHAIP